MKSLLTGHKAFAQNARRMPDVFAKLATGQAPQALVLTCADSRVSPSVLMGADLGSIFVVRNAGNMIAPHGTPNTGGGESASLEYAVVCLEVENIIVMGHSQCGAMGALMDPAATRGIPLVADWLQRAGDARKRAMARLTVKRGDAIQTLAQESVRVQLENLMSYPFVEEAMKAGNLTLHGWYFDIARGEILALDDETDTFKPLVAEDGA